MKITMHVLTGWCSDRLITALIDDEIFGDEEPSYYFGPFVDRITDHGTVEIEGKAASMIPEVFVERTGTA